MRPSHVIVMALVGAVIVVAILLVTGVFDPPAEMHVDHEPDVRVPSSEERIAAVRDRMAREQGVAPENVQQRHNADVEATAYGFDVRRVLPEVASDEVADLVESSVDECRELVEAVTPWTFAEGPTVEVVDRRTLIIAIREDAIAFSHAFDSSTLIPQYGGLGEPASRRWMSGGHAMKYATVEGCTRIAFYDASNERLLVAPVNVTAICDELDIPEESRGDVVKSVLCHALAVALLDEQFDLSYRNKVHPTVSGARAIQGVVHGYGALVQDAVADAFELTPDEQILAKRMAIGAIPLRHPQNHIHLSVVNDRFQDLIQVGQEFVEAHLDAAGPDRLAMIVQSPPVDMDVLNNPRTYRPALDYVKLFLHLDELMTFEGLGAEEVWQPQTIYDRNLSALTDRARSTLDAAMPMTRASVAGTTRAGPWRWAGLSVVARHDLVPTAERVLGRALEQRHVLAVARGAHVEGSLVVEPIAVPGADTAVHSTYIELIEGNEITVHEYRVVRDRMIAELVLFGAPQPVDEISDRFAAFLDAYEHERAQLEVDFADAP